ncbi:MAG: diguanylate cyclase [Nakamurella sp.]
MNFELMFDEMPTAYLLVDRDLVIVEANKAYLTMLARSRADLVGRGVFEAFPPSPDTLDVAGRSPVELSFRRARSSGEPDVLPLHQYNVLDPRTGIVETRFWSLINAPLRGADGTVAYILQRVEDVTDYVRDREERVARTPVVDASAREVAAEAELYVRMQELRAARDAERAAVAALQESEARARAVLDTAGDAIITFDRAGLVTSMNRAAGRMFGRFAAATIGRNVAILLQDPGRRGAENPVLDALGAGGTQVVIADGEFLGCHRDGRLFPVELAVSDVGLASGLFTAVIRDISERKRLETRLAHQSLHDPLTGLANRTLLHHRLDHEVSRLARHPGVLAVLFIDLDGFKAVNDTLGHAAGDALLVATADRLRLGCRNEDLVTRYGGDEFVAVCAELTHPAEATAIAARLDGLLSAPVELAGRQIHPRASVGVITDDGTRTPDQLLHAADTAMYSVKRGRTDAR